MALQRSAVRTRLAPFLSGRDIVNLGIYLPLWRGGVVTAFDIEVTR